MSDVAAAWNENVAEIGEGARKFRQGRMEDRQGGMFPVMKRMRSGMGDMPAADPKMAAMEPGADSRASLVGKLVDNPDFSTLVAAVSVATDDNGNKLVDDLNAEGPFTAGSHRLRTRPLV